MNPSKVIRKNVTKLTDLPNIGKSLAEDLIRIGILKPDDLIAQDAKCLYDRLCDVDGCRHDPCVLDVFMSITDFMSGSEPKVWWNYTAERKNRFDIL